MRDLTDDEAAEFDAHHARLVELLENAGVSNVVEKLLAHGYKSAREFVSALLRSPQVRALLAAGDEIAGDAVGALVAGAVASAGLAPLAMPAGGASAVLVKRGLAALHAKIETALAAPSPAPQE